MRLANESIIILHDSIRKTIQQGQDKIKVNTSIKNKTRLNKKRYQANKKQMQQVNKDLKNTFKELSNEELQNLQRLYIRYNHLKEIKNDKIYQQQLQKAAPYIRNLRLVGFEILDELANDGDLDLKDFQNLEMLSISYIEGSDYDMNEYLGKNLRHLLKLKQLKKLFIDVSSYGLEHIITEELQKLLPLFKQLDILRIELGESDIRDIGCEMITNTLSQLNNLKELQLGLEQNNLGNYSFMNVITMISKLNLEKLQLDFWENKHDEDAFYNLKDILSGTNICKSLKELRFHQDYHNCEQQNPIPLLEAFTLFTNLKKIYFPINVNMITSEVATVLNQLLQNNKNTLETFIFDFIPKRYDQKSEPTSNSINILFENIEQVVNLKNLCFELHPQQTLESIQQFFGQISNCKNLSRLGIRTSFKEIRTAPFKECIQYFKDILNLDHLLHFQYAKYEYNLDQEWNNEFYEQTWRYEQFLDPSITNKMLSTYSDDKSKNKYRSLIEDFNQDIPGLNSNSYLESEHSQSDDEDEEWEDESFDEEEEQQEQNRENGRSEQSDKKNSTKLQTLTFEEQEQSMDLNYKMMAKLDQQKLVPYLITQRHFAYKRIELIRLVVYQKQFQDLFQNKYQSSPHLIRNFWDLYY